MNSLKDWLVIVHTSDVWLEKSKHDTEYIKNAIRERALFYLENKKKVYYTPYYKKEENLPSYLWWLDIKNLSENLGIDCKDLINFQIFLLRYEFYKDYIRNIEMVWSWSFACLRTTNLKINYLTQTEIFRFQRHYWLDISNISKKHYNFLTSFIINSEINENLSFK